MKDIEKYLKDNQEHLNSSEPEAGHFNRFEGKLNSIGNKKSRKIDFTQILKIAAVLLLLVLSSLWIYDNIINKESDSKNMISKLSLSDISPEYQEAEFYYTSMIKDKYTTIENHDFSSDSLEKELLLAEIAAMDTLYQNLQSELNSNPNDERVVTAIIEHYQLKVKVLNTIIDKLNYVKPQNIYNYESIEL